MVKKYSELYVETRRTLMNTESREEAAILARRLLCFVTGKTQEQFLADSEMYASDAVCEALDAVVKRVLNDEPLAYILGQWEFYGLPLFVSPNVLIPRDDTCAVAELAIAYAQKIEHAPRILDLCTGSGCIGLAIASRVKNARVTLADISKEALIIAKKNVTLNHLTGRVFCVEADALGTPPAFLGKVDMIVSNPPYITAEEMTDLPKSVADYEPHLALFGGENGLDFYRAIIENYTEILNPGGYLAFEFGMGQGDAVCNLLTEKGYTILERSSDYNDRERACLAQLGRKVN